MAETRTIHELTCLRCGFRWLPRQLSRPTACPDCRSRKWDKASSPPAAAVRKDGAAGEAP